jgi:GNAT superfamily N-acetyltransferase
VPESFRIEPLTGDHDRSRFLSGSDGLDRYFRELASQDIKRRIATCFVAVCVTTEAQRVRRAPPAGSGTVSRRTPFCASSSEDVAGYYTLAATNVALNALAPEIPKKLPRYPVVPAVLLGRLAVTRHYQGHGLGGILLADALKRTARAELGVFAMVVDAKDQPAQRFYERYGFTLLPGDVRRLCLPITVALQSLASRRS